ncbi:c-type cytochrome biogenesis protein CcmI [Roseomonas hellenica]|uniref:C-type cytochrome biogenesis protein CcmI n=1 Tax=Plastoroseomonas hellenica TaxID=2687306 RepID=A0ABS5EYB6_9PROT|nr:c-type cytochrome biogenesis protein CcmI [Plastoroseomonas hellenica]MBR0665278.1 c-type cytochrome biogenesis protein CcmI [Plastoroseomonas hellenica]
MTWLLIAILAVLALAPLALALLRPPHPRGRAEADRALYAAQRAELDREHAEGRMDEASHRAALLELQRRLLAAPQADPAAPQARRASRPLLAVLALVPLLALGLYLLRGTPDMPSAPYTLRHEVAEQEEALVGALRARLAQVDPTSDGARQGYVLLGNAERSRGRFDAAAEAWTRALAARFDPGLAGDVAEIEIERGRPEAAAPLLARALSERPGDPRLRFLSGLAEARAGRPESARTTWQALLADAPPEAPWRSLVQRQLDTLP